MALTKQEIIELIDSERGEQLAFLQRLVRTPSSNPPGDTTEAINVVRDFLARLGIDSETIVPRANAPNLVSVLNGPRGGKRLVLNGHIDQFPVKDADQWSRSPYSGDVEDGFIYGRGVVDMKAGTAASILAFSYLHRLQEQLSGQCVLEVVSDEETGGKFGTRYLLEQHEHKDVWKGDAVLNAEPGGVESIRFGEKGTLRMTFTIKTPGGHGAFLHRDEGAIRIAARLIERLIGIESLSGEGMDPELRAYLQRDDVKAVADKIMGPGAAAIMLNPTVNIGTISGGAKVNMIPSSCTFEADIRLPIGLIADTVLKYIDTLLYDIPEASYTIQTAASNPAAASPVSHELVDRLQSNARSVRGSKPLPICSLGATDVKHFRYHGAPGYTYGVSPETMAQRDERAKVEEFGDVVKVHTLTAWDYLSGGQ